MRIKLWFIDGLTTIEISDFLKNNLVNYVSFTFAVLPLFLMELVVPNDKTSQDHKLGILFWIISLQANYFFSFISKGALNYFDIGSIINLSFENLSANSIINPLLINIFLIVLALLIFDFFYYWFHRMQHTVSFFWEFHKTHHSIVNLNSIVSYHHLSEELFRIPFIILPLAILIKIDTPQIALLSSFYAAYGQFIHMNSKISLGSLRLFFADNYYHRIHHSIEPHHYDKNFAAFFPIWDILFKTICLPVHNEFPKVGLTSESQPKTIKEYLFHPKPFKKRHKSLG